MLAANFFRTLNIAQRSVIRTNNRLFCNLVPRSQTEGKIWSNLICTCEPTCQECRRQWKSACLQEINPWHYVLNNEFDRALKSSLTNMVIEYTHILNINRLIVIVVLVLCNNIKFDKTVNSNLIIIALYKSSNPYVSNSIWEFFYPFKNSLYWYRERVLKSLKRFKDKNGFTSYNETKNVFFTTIFHWTKLKTSKRMNCMCHIVRTGEN